ncbi:MAG: SAM-dependent methyltransferase [Eubacterium sp.]|nr:SAM-dependent methyltransferase [Eubacterium sp.]
MQKLSKRLLTCASLVNKGARLADVGCDHGYVPVYLVEQGLIENAVASDINEGPLNSCKSLVKMQGLENRIKCVLSDGLEKIELDDIDDILIAGMGGILIYEILDSCDFEKLKNKHLILNPMTHPEEARLFLYNYGFRINNDIIVEDSGHHYNVMDAYYTGVIDDYDYDDYRLACWLGNIKDFSDKEYFLHLINYFKNMEKGGADYSVEIKAIEEKLNDNG